MKKTLLISVAASAFLMAGGDVAPIVEPAVVVPAQVEETSAWDFRGQGVVYYQTSDMFGQTDLGSNESSAYNSGVSLDVDGELGSGFGIGGQLIGLHSNKSWTGKRMMDGDGQMDNGSAAFTKAYLTYGIGNTSVKVGRQELPKSLSPFAFSEKWNLFSNTFQAAVIVNSDIKDTTLVGAYVDSANNYADMSDFNDINKDGVYMLTAQNKSIKDLTLTGSYYFAGDANTNGDLDIVWGDATYKSNGLVLGGQGGYVFGDAVDSVETTVFGVKAGMHGKGMKGCVSYTSVDDGSIAVQNLGTGERTPLYTQMLLNENYISSDADTFVAKGSLEAYGAEFGAAYGYTTDNSLAEMDYSELDLTYSRKIGNNMKLFAAYIYSDMDVAGTDGNNFVRLWGKYNF